MISWPGSHSEYLRLRSMNVIFIYFLICSLFKNILEHCRMGSYKYQFSDIDMKIQQGKKH